MRDIFIELTSLLEQVCPVFQQVPKDAAYPYVTLSPLQSLKGLPWGPTIVVFTAKIFSQYAGTKEILKAATDVEALLHTASKREP